MFNGGLEEIRTPDPRNANAMRSQLRYKPMSFVRRYYIAREMESQGKLSNSELTFPLHADMIYKNGKGYAMKFRKVYLEISNICNLKCSFCPGTVRTQGMLDVLRFSELMPKLRPWTDYLYFHLMGEPLLHPQLGDFLDIAWDAGFRVILTTNGTLISKQQNLLLSKPALHKVNISLHSFEANEGKQSFEQYLDDCFQYAQAASAKKLTVLRLWNQGGKDSRNTQILEQMEEYFPKPWKVEPRGTRIGDKVYLEYGDKFDWPDWNAAENTGRNYCYGLRDQIGVLWDGTVVPCCLDHDGSIPLGNLFQSSLADILNTPEAKAIYNGFSSGVAVHPLCRRCGYAKRFQ